MITSRVFAPLVGGPNAVATLAAAITVGEGLEAHLEVCFLRPDPEEAAGYALLSAAQEIETSLQVMGGYAHNRFEEAVFAGTTLHAMRHSHLPVLMTH